MRQEPSPVVILKTGYSQLDDTFSRMFEYVGVNLITRAKRIVIKINLCDYKPPETGAVTHPAFLDAFLGWINGHCGPANIDVVESDATSGRPDMISRWLGIDQIIRRHGAKWVNLSKDTWTRKRVQGLRFSSVKVPDTIARSDLLISMAKMKTHTLTTMSCSLKNQFGCIMFPRKIRFHDALDEAIVDACTAMPPKLAIVDGIVAMGGTKGPIDGVPIHAGLIVAGTDLVAVDAACAAIMGLNPNRIGHLRKAESVGLGSIRFEPLGDGIPDELPDFETDEFYRRILKYAMTLQTRSITWG